MAAPEGRANWIAPLPTNPNPKRKRGMTYAESLAHASGWDSVRSGTVQLAKGLRQRDRSEVPLTRAVARRKSTYGAQPEGDA